ncbi:MAG: YggS family pyridoxal phosphate enzyme, partial [Comamonadaceae bacterium]
MTTIADNLQHVRQRIAAACAAARRDVNEVTLLAVAKTFG